MSMPSRPIPPRPSLEFDRKQARALLEAVRRGEAGAAERFRAHHPRFRDGAVAHAALHDAQLVIAREYGVASWPRWKQLVEMRQLEARERAALLVCAACEGDMRQASMLLAADPALERFDVYTACVAGADGEVARRLDRDSALARGRGGPLDREPILYACFSRFLRSDAKRAAGILRVVRLLLDHGADVNVHFLRREGNETWVQTSLYGAAGIANNAELTQMLLTAGADVNELHGEPGDSGESCGLEALYHASEFADMTCLRLLLERAPAAPSQARLVLPGAHARLREPGRGRALSAPRRRSQLPYPLDARPDASSSRGGVRAQPSHRAAPRGGGRRAQRPGRSRPHALPVRRPQPTGGPGAPAPGRGGGRGESHRGRSDAERPRPRRAVLRSGAKRRHGGPPPPRRRR